MSSQKKSSPPIGGTIVLIIFIALVLVVIMAFLEVEPFPSIKTDLRKWAQSIQVQAQQLLSTNQTILPATAIEGFSSQDITTAQSQTISNWEYTLNSSHWDGHTATVNISIRNLGGQTVPFGFSYQVSDESFASAYKLCAQDSSKQIYWDSSIDTQGTGFYNRYFAPSETKTGLLKFTVNPGSEKIYLCLSIGGNAANKLFYLGSPP
jgi:hypothetical protein